MRTRRSRRSRAGSAAATSWYSCPASARYAMWASICNVSCRTRRCPGAVFAPVLGAAKQDFSARPAATHRIGDQCRRDLDHGAQDPGRHRLRARAHQPLQPAQPSAASAHRAHIPRQRRSAQGPLRALRRRSVPAPVLGRRFRGTAGLHRARGAAHESRRAAAAPGRGFLGRGRGLSLHRCARLPGARRRLSAACRNSRPWTRIGASRAAAAPWRACRWIRAWRARCSRASAFAPRANCWPSSRA